MTVLPRAWTLRAFPLAVAALVAGASATWAQQAPPVDPLEAAAMSVAPGRDAASRHDDRAHPKGDAQRALKQRALQARLAGKTSGKTHHVANGQYVELEREGEDSSGRYSASSARGESDLRRPAGPLHNQIPQPDRAVDNTTIWTPDFTRPTTRTCCSTRRPARSRCATSTSSSPSNRYAVNGAVTDWVQVPFNEANTAPTTAAASSARTWLFVQRLADAWYNGQVAGREVAHRSTPIWRSSTCGIATTTTATATSTSPTATSTTSSRSTPVKARRRAAAPRAPTRSGATAGTRSTPHRPGRRRPTTARRRPHRQLQLLDRRLHDRAGERRRRRVLARVRPRPRPARPVRHSAATPVAPRTRPASGRSCQSARTAATAPGRHRHRSRAHERAGRSSSSGWSNYEVAVAGQKSATSSDPPRPTRSRPRGSCAPARQGRSAPPSAPRSPAATSTTRGRATISTTHDPADHPSGAGPRAVLPGSVPDRDLLGLRLRRGVDRRRRDVDQRRHELVDEHEPQPRCRGSHLPRPGS